LKYTEASIGRIFILRLEKGDIIPKTIEDFAREKKIESASVFFIGGADKGSKVVVGPEDGSAIKPIPVTLPLPRVSESLGVGTIFKNEEGVLKLHMHSAFGHGKDTIAGCTRQGVDVWLYGEVIIMELVNSSAKRKVDPQTGFELLEV